MAEPNHLLRAARQAAGSPASPGLAMSRSELAESVNASIYRRTGREARLDGHYVAKLERGVIRWPGDGYRTAFREVLGAATDSDLGFRMPRRNSDLGSRLPTLPSTTREPDRERLTRIVSGDCSVDETAVRSLEDVLMRQRNIDDVLGSIRMMPVVLAEIGLVEHLTRHARETRRIALVTLLAEYHEFAGWIADHNGDHLAALHHYAAALRTAREVDEANLVAAVCGLRSHMAWARGDVVGTIVFAEAGQRDARRLSRGVVGFLVQMQARGHAQACDRSVAERLIDASHQLTTRAAEHPEDEPWWAYHQTVPGRGLFQRGLVHLELDRPREARDLVAEAAALLPVDFRRDHGRWAATLAVACAADGDLSAAFAAALQAIDIVAETGSVYTVADLERARGSIARQHPDQAMIDELDRALAQLAEEGIVG
jgi:hypothetical protein